MQKEYYPIHLTAKPVGPDCNLCCKYCFYLEKNTLFKKSLSCRMSDEVLEAYIKHCILVNKNSKSEILFAWHGGEPTLAGLEFFRRAIVLEKKYIADRLFSNTLQTNGMLLNDEWCEFLVENNFLVGLSIDGPDFIHDHNRVDKVGNPTFGYVLRALKLLQKHGVKYNVLACVSDYAAKYPEAIYNFFKDQKVEFIQFSPIVERLPNIEAKQLGLKFCTPPKYETNEDYEIALCTIKPEEFANFNIKIFDTWVRNDVGKMFVMNFEWLLHAWIGGSGSICYLNHSCGNNCIVEHNGNVYSCDHFVYPDFHLGNILENDIRTLLDSKRHKEFGISKENLLSNECRACEFFSICRGGCPKHRFVSFFGDTKLNYLCSGYKKFYRHIKKYMQAFQILLEHEMPCEYIMQAIDKPLLFTSKTTNQQILLSIK